MLFLGYDPGGRHAAGAAVLELNGRIAELLAVGTFESVDEAFNFFIRTVDQGHVEAAGIDALLSWATRASGWREVDRYLRRAYPEVASSVLASNTLAGSMAVQGMAMALKLRQVWPQIILNETHPKVLYYALSGNQWDYGPSMGDWLAERVVIPPGLAVSNEHEWDAVFSAWATAVAFADESGWQDLMDLPDKLLFPAGPVTYRWPGPQTGLTKT